MTNNNNEIWVFLSHSNKDYDKVREVRNLLEEQNFRPLMFFLNCLNDDDEIDSLIKREIDSRKRFILCDSPNAKSSKWVQKEVEYIKSKQRYYYTIDLDDTSDVIAQNILQFAGESTVYISCAHNDEQYYEQLKIMLQDDLGLRVFDYKKDLVVGEYWDNQLKSVIDRCQLNGYVIFLITDSFLKSQYGIKELDHVLSKQNLNHVIFLRESCVKRPPMRSYDFAKEFTFMLLNGKFEIDKGRFYWEFYRERLFDGIRKGDTASLYWVAHHYYWDDDRFDNSDIGGMRKAVLENLKQSIDKGYKPAKELYDNILYCYPELDGMNEPKPDRRPTDWTTWIKEFLGIK